MAPGRHTKALLISEMGRANFIYRVYSYPTSFLPYRYCLGSVMRMTVVLLRWGKPLGAWQAPGKLGRFMDQDRQMLRADPCFFALVFQPQ